MADKCDTYDNPGEGTSRDQNYIALNTPVPINLEDVRMGDVEVLATYNVDENGLLLECSSIIPSITPPPNDEDIIQSEGQHELNAIIANMEDEDVNSVEDEDVNSVEDAEDFFA